MATDYVAQSEAVVNLQEQTSKDPSEEASEGDSPKDDYSAVA